MKRHADLIAFSREHHQALRLSNHILKYPEENHDSEIIAQRADLLHHFEQEEQQFSAYWHLLQRTDLQQRFEAEHTTLRQLLQPPFQAALLAENLLAHVRFEERILFEAFGQLLRSLEEASPSQ